MHYRVLVTGSSGFIGKALVPALAQAGHHVRAAARRPAAALSGVEAAIQPDIEKPVDWSPLVDGMDVVVHLAGLAHRQGGDAVDYNQANRATVADLAKACTVHGVQRLIFMSSIGAQTGSASDQVVTEDLPPHPVADYDRSKLAAEEDVRRSGANYTILRPVIVYGPHPKANVALLVKLAGLPFPLPFAAFHNRRSLLALDNLIAAVLACFDTPQTLNQTFVVSDPEPITLAEMLRVMRRAQNRSPHLWPVPPVLFELVLKAIGRSQMWDRVGRGLIVDPRKLRDAGWRPVVATGEGLTAMIRGSKR